MLRGDLATRNARIDQLTTEITAAREHHDDLAGQLEAARSAIQAQQREIAVARQHHADIGAQLDRAARVLVRADGRDLCGAGAA